MWPQNIFAIKLQKRPFAALFVDKNKHHGWHGNINAEKNDFE